MKARREKSFRSWMLIYAGMVAAAVFTVQERGVMVTDSARVSPVALDSQFPIVEIDSTARRSDI